MTKKNFLLFLLLFCVAQGFPQESTTWEQYLDELSETEDFESTTWEQYYDVLAEYAEQPMNINTATREDLKRLPFLGDQQIEDILAYIYQYGEMKSMGELAMISSLNWYQHKLLEIFTYPGEIPRRKYPTLKDILRYGKNEVVAAVKVPFYDRKGDIEGYQGYKYKHWIRYKFHYGDYVKFGILGSQDAGEPFFSGVNNHGYDFYSFYLQVRKLGWLKNLTVGRYRLKMGLGLVINNNFSLGKTNTLTSLGSSSNTISVHSSRSQGNYLQGAAATVTLFKGLDLTAFVSYRKIDATLTNDDTAIATVVTSGYHRTETEIKKKDNSSQTMAGGNLNYSNNGFHVGVTGLYTSYDKPLQPSKTSLYKQYYAEGNGFWNMSVDYGYMNHRLAIHGETATGDCGAIATINTASYLLTSDLSLIALQRFYSYKYYAIFGNSFSEGSSVQDESGFYLGANWTISPKLSLFAYTDIAYFPWPKYQAAASSHSWDSMLSATYHPGAFTIFARYRLKRREKDNDDKTALIYKDDHKGRLSVGYTSSHLTAKVQYDASFCQYKENSFGWMTSGNLGYNNRWLQVNGSIGYFHTKDYNSRVYSYEPGILYTFSSSSFYGEGIRYAFRIRTDIGKHWMLIAKIGVTDYFDRDHISSSYQQIDKSSQTDLDVQLRWKF